MSRAWDKEKNLSPRRESNPRSSVNQSDALTIELSYFLSELKIHHLSLLTTHRALSTLLILAVCRR